MGTQFSKIKVTQRVEVHGQVIHDYYAINQNGGYYQAGSDLMMESNYNHSNYSNQIMERLAFLLFVFTVYSTVFEKISQ